MPGGHNVQREVKLPATSGMLPVVYCRRAIRHTDVHAAGETTGNRYACPRGPPNTKGRTTMTKKRLALLGILAAFALTGVTTATASAHEFLVNGSALNVLLHGAFTSTTSRLRFELLNKKSEIISTLDTGTFSIGPNGTSTYEISFTGNTIDEIGSGGELIAEPNCVIKLITFHGTDELLEHESKLLDTFAGSEQPVFTHIKIENLSAEKTCAFKGTFSIEGTLNAILNHPETPEKLRDLEFNPAVAGSQSLTLAGKPATFESIESLELYDEASWKMH